MPGPIAVLGAIAGIASAGALVGSTAHQGVTANKALDLSKTINDREMHLMDRALRIREETHKSFKDHGLSPAAAAILSGNNAQHYDNTYQVLQGTRMSKPIPMFTNHNNFDAITASMFGLSTAASHITRKNKTPISVGVQATPSTRNSGTVMWRPTTSTGTNTPKAVNSRGTQVEYKNVGARIPWHYGGFVTDL